jgi:hypothetical protein
LTVILHDKTKISRDKIKCVVIFIANFHQFQWEQKYFNDYIIYFFKKQQQDQIRIEDLEKQLESLTTLNKEVSLILFGIFYIGMSNYTSE